MSEQYYIPNINVQGPIIQELGNNAYVSRGSLRSPNYVKDVKGWSLESDGSIYGVSIYALGGQIGGWTISSSALYKDGATDNVSSGMASADYPFYAGKKYADRATAPYRVTPAGALVATSATISGAITTGAGSSIDGTYITATSIEANKLNVSQLSAISADLGSVTAGTITGGTLRTAASGARVVIDNTGIKQYDASAQRAQILNDGSGWLGSSTAISWTSAGVVSMNWANVSGTGKPENNATVGAKAGTNLKKSDNTILNDADVVTSQGTASDTSRVNTIAAAQVQSRAEALYKQIVAIGSYDDGFSTSVGAGAITRSLLTTKFTLNTVGSGNRLYSPAFGDGFSWNNDYTVTCRLSVTMGGTSISEQAFFGLANFGAIYIGGAFQTKRHVGFAVVNGTLYASMSDGTTNEKASIAGITLSSKNNYRIDFDAGVNAKFYVNDVLKATLSTRIPTGTTDLPLLDILVYEDASVGSVNINMVVNNNYQIISS